MQRLLTAAVLASLTLSGLARAEVIELVDKTKINGKIIHYYDGIYSVETQGQTMKIPREKIRSISFQLPPARAEFSTAEKTFDRWRKAVTDGDLEKAIDCYALMYQGVVATHLGQSAEGIKQMKKEIEGTKFVVKGSSVKGDSATLKVLRQKGEESETGEVAFVRENGEWKMLPPQPPQ
jgi:ketosteroid isomerase-like protein